MTATEQIAADVTFVVNHIMRDAYRRYGVPMNPDGATRLRELTEPRGMHVTVAVTQLPRCERGYTLSVESYSCVVGDV